MKKYVAFPPPHIFLLILFCLSFSVHANTIYTSALYISNSYQFDSSSSPKGGSDYRGYGLNLGISTKRWAWFKLGTEISYNNFSFLNNDFQEGNRNKAIDAVMALSIFTFSDNMLEVFIGGGYCLHSFNTSSSKNNSGYTYVARLITNIPPFSVFLGRKTYRFRKYYRSTGIVTTEFGIRLFFK